MKTTENDANPTNSQVNEKRWKFGEVNPDTGLVFYQYAKASKGGIRWVTPEIFQGYRDRKADADKRSWEKHREKRRAQKREYYRENPEKVGKGARKWRDENPEKAKAWMSEYQKKNRATINSRNRKRRKSDPLFALALNARIRVWQAINKRGFPKRSKTADIIGCDWDMLKSHLEKYFQEGMSWDRRDEFHIDHHIPLASAETVEEVEKLCHYTNLRPLWAADNLAKRAKMPEEFYG